MACAAFRSCFDRRQLFVFCRAKVDVEVAPQQVVQGLLCRGKLVLILQQLNCSSRELGLHFQALGLQHDLLRDILAA